MRMIAPVISAQSAAKRVMLYETPTCCYLFHYNTLDDGPCFADTWFVRVTEAKLACYEEFGIEEAGWTSVPDPLPGCQNDIIAPTKAIRDEHGHVTFEPAPEGLSPNSAVL